MCPAARFADADFVESLIHFRYDMETGREYSGHHASWMTFSYGFRMSEQNEYDFEVTSVRYLCPCAY